MASVIIMEPAPETTLLTDAEVVLRTLKERNAFGVLIERYEDKLRRYIGRCGACLNLKLPLFRNPGNSFIQHK